MTKEQRKELIEIANDFAQIKDLRLSSDFYMTISRDHVALQSVLRFPVRFDKSVDIHFKILFPANEENPRRNCKIKFPVDDRTRHMVTRYNLRDYIEGLFFNQINK
jgi:hypothetical protein